MQTLHDILQPDAIIKLAEESIQAPQTIGEAIPELNRIANVEGLTLSRPAHLKEAIKIMRKS